MDGPFHTRMNGMRYLALATIVILAAGCQSGMGSGSLFSSAAPSQPANAVLAGNVIAPPPTGSFVPPQFAAGGFTPTPNSFTAASVPQRYQPLSLSGTNPPQAAPGFNAAATPPAAYPPSNPFSTTGFNSSTPNATTPPATYAGNNPLLSWANRFNNYLFSSTPQPGQWQSYSGSMPVSNTGGFISNPAPGFTPTNFTPPSNATSNTTNNAWQNRPEPRSLRSTDTYAPEAPIRIPDSALAGEVNASRSNVATNPITPPPTYPARSNAVTQPAVPVAPLPPRATINAATKIVSDPAWPEITSLPRGR